MVEWLKQLVIGDGNVVGERSYTNWNKLDTAEIIAEKTKQDASQAPDSSNRGVDEKKNSSDK
jgi:hypothetical protein